MEFFEAAKDDNLNSRFNFRSGIGSGNSSLEDVKLGTLVTVMRCDVFCTLQRELVAEWYG